MSAIRGVLLAGQFRTNHELIRMPHDDQRNTLIVELAARTKQRGPLSPSSGRRFQAMDDATLAGLGAIYVFLRAAKIRTEAELMTMSDDDLRNTLIVELSGQPNAGSGLQGLDNLALVRLGLNHTTFRGDIMNPPTYLRGCLLAGSFRTQHELNRMSADDQRNTLITELAGRIAQRPSPLSPSLVARLQSMDDGVLAGLGAAYLFLRNGRSRTEEQLRTLSDDDIRNTLIVEVDGQTHRGTALQALSNMSLVRLGLGLEPEPMPSGPLHPPIEHRRMLQFRLRGFSEHKSTDNFLQGANDEVYLSATGFDSATVAVDQEGKAVPELVEAPTIGDVSAPHVRDPWSQSPQVLLEFNLDRPGHYPRTYVVTLLMVEHDSQDLSEAFEALKSVVGKKAREAVTAAAASAGAVAGTAILPGIGTAVGAAAGALAGLAWDELILAIGEGLENESFTPRTLTMKFPSEADLPESIGRPQVLRVEEHGARYDIEYDWHVQS